MALRIYIALLIFLCLLCGCQREQMDHCVMSTGNIHTELRSMDGYHSIDLDDRIDLVMEHGSATTIAVEAGENLIDQVITEVRDSVLYIRNDNRCNWVRSFKPRITVSVPVEVVRKLTLRGTGDVTARDTIVRHEFGLEQWGAMGTVDLLLDVNVVKIGLHTGAGNVVIKGMAGHLAEYYSGMLGIIDASQLMARYVSINSSGVGDMRCWATDGMDVQILDAGDVYYRGDPLEFYSLITGTGRLIKDEQ